MSAVAVAAAAVTVRVSNPGEEEDPKEQRPRGRPAHHANDTKSLFTNPWPSFGKRTVPNLSEMWEVSSTCAHTGLVFDFLVNLFLGIFFVTS